MAHKILSLGDPGSGKTTAAESLDPKKTFIICSDKKGLPFRNWKNNYKTILIEGKLDIEKSNYYETSSPSIISKLIKLIAEKRPDIEVIMVDTITAVMENEYMLKAKEKGFDKYTDMALDTYNVLTSPDDIKRNDLVVIFNAHTEDNYDSEGTLKTSFKVVGGKLIGQNIKVEGRFNIVLYTEVIMNDNVPNYHFLTQTNGKNTCRSPKGMFDELKIPNDYNFVINRMKEYYG